MQKQMERRSPAPDGFDFPGRAARGLPEAQLRNAGGVSGDKILPALLPHGRHKQRLMLFPIHALFSIFKCAIVLALQF